MAARYEHNYRAFGDQVLRAGFMRTAMESRANAIRAHAEGISPVDEGEYIDSFEVTTAITAYGGKSTRWGARVHNHAPHALAVEFGFGNVPRYRVLGRSLYTIGQDVKVKRL